MDLNHVYTLSFTPNDVAMWVGYAFIAFQLLVAVAAIPLGTMMACWHLGRKSAEAARW